MTSFQADLELTTLHIKRLEARLAAQRAKIAVMRAVGRDTENEVAAVRELEKSLAYLRRHHANITALPTTKAS